MATAIYAGLLDDSNGLLSDDVDGTTFATVKELIECGAEFKVCNKQIMKSVSLAALRLKAIMLKNMTLMFDARVAVFCVSNDEMRMSGAVGEDCESALEESLGLPQVQVSLLLKENSDFSIKGSLRSNGSVDVSKIALSFGGGGHASRSGFIIKRDETLENIKEEILNLIKKEM